MDELDLVLMAMIDLRRERPIWNRNLQVYRAMDVEQKSWWWARAKQQAQLGVPAMEELVVKVVTLRMKV